MKKKTVMIVDDEYLIAESDREILKKAGYNVITALSGPEALKKLRENKIDLVLIDLLMPGMSGIELTKKIRADDKFKDLKIAYLTIINLSKDYKNMN